MILIRYILLYIIILSPAIFLADIFNKKIEKTIHLSLIEIVIIMYIFGLINKLFEGVIFTSVINILLLIYTVVKNIKNNTINILKEKIITKGSIFFTVIFFLFVLVTMNRELTNWDQFTYWSLACKDMFYTNKITLTIEAVTQYPPVPTVLQYFFMKIIGEYRQGIEIFVTWILSFSFFIPLFEKSNQRKIVNIAIAFIILCVPAVFGMLIFYESSYPDALLGIIIGYVSFLYFFGEKSKFETFSISMTLILLTLTKSTGFVIALILFATFLIYEILTKRLKEEKGVLVIFLAVILSTLISWNLYLHICSNNIAAPKNNIKENKVKTIINSITSTVFTIYEGNNDEAGSNGKLIEKLYKVTEITTPIKISAGALICIYLFIMVIYYKKAKNKKNTLNTIISIFTGLILYICALQLAYLTQFSNKEMLAHDGMERYIASYLLGILYIIVAVWLKETKETNRNFPYILLASIILMITPIYSVANATITSGIYNLNTAKYCNMGLQKAKKISNEIEIDEKVLGICQDTKVEMEILNVMIKYYTYPQIYKPINKIKEPYTLAEILKQEKYDYIYIISTDDYLNKEIKEILNIDKIEDNKLYKLQKN